MDNSTNIQETLKIALIQFTPVWENSTENQFQLEQIISEIPANCDLVVLPEAFSTGFSMNAAKVSQDMDGETVNWMKRISSEKNSVICGSLFIVENGNYFNRFCWVQPDGVVLQYNKRHLFSMGNEDQTYTKGSKSLLIDFKGWKIAPQICYDLRFPVWSRNTSGYHLLINVASWPSSRSEVWNTLLKARAIENQCYVVGVNRTGSDGNGIDHQGDSMLIDFKGKTICTAMNSNSTLIVELNRVSIMSFRKKFDTLKDADRFNLI